MFQEVRARIPSMATCLESCYSSQPILHLNDQVILSCWFSKGTPLVLWGLLWPFTLLLRRLMRRSLAFSSMLGIYTMGPCAVPWMILLRLLPLLKLRVPVVAYVYLNKSKCLLAVADVPVSNSILSDIPLVTGGFDLLGSPIGPAVYCKRYSTG